MTSHDESSEEKQSPEREEGEKETKTIKVEYLARVEGEGSLFVKTRAGEVEDVKLKIFEPPRFFEALLEGRSFTEAPDITARICGICPVAYQMSAVHAMEDLLGYEIAPEVRRLRRLLYCGEWIESHVLHIFMLHLPDFMGYESAVEMARDHRELVERALRLKKAGNQIVEVLGGREIHPINVKVGGFYRYPRAREFKELIKELKWAREAMVETAEVLADLHYPDFERDYEFISLYDEEEYPMNEGRILSSKGWDIPVAEYENHFREIHVERSHALHSVLKDGSDYMVGALARFNLAGHLLPDRWRKMADQIGLEKGCKNPFRTILARAVEVAYSFDQALQILADYRRPEEKHVEPVPKGGKGFAATEAPRGLLYHRYDIDSKGLIEKAKIVPPTSQNQKCIEEDLFYFVKKFIHLSSEELTWKCEQAIRNYDPCISCATHFLKLKVEEE